jgi:hypothetical protein
MDAIYVLIPSPHFKYVLIYAYLPRHSLQTRVLRQLFYQGTEWQQK